jgi:hypothetical protein
MLEQLGGMRGSVVIYKNEPVDLSTCFRCSARSSYLWISFGKIGRHLTLVETMISAHAQHVLLTCSSARKALSSAAIACLSAEPWPLQLTCLCTNSALYG